MSRSRIVLLSCLAACSGSESGTITASVYGEAFIEDGIPADEFSDGWAVSFDTFLVSIGDLAAKAGEGSAEVTAPAYHIVDLAQSSGGEGYELATLDVPAGRYEHYGYQLRADAAALAYNVDDATAAAMKAGGYAMWVRGSATKAGVTKTFDWGFTMKLAYAHCDLGGSIDGNTLPAQATIHADHLFYDDAVSDEPNLAFQLIADADADADGAVTLAELAAVDIRSQARYQVGSLKHPTGTSITNLQQYVEHQVITVGHINGEGHCEDQLAQP